MKSEELSILREQVVETTRRLGLLPVVRAPDAERAMELSRALFAGGIHALEITMTVPGAEQVISRLCAELGAAALVGAGTVTDVDSALRCLDAGAKFLVSPATLPDLVTAGHARGAAVMLGALTPTEVLNAYRAGADFVKVFPCSALGGADYLKALRAPFPHIPLLPTGGVTLETMPAYWAAGAAALGVGGALADAQVLQTQGAGAISALARRYVECLRSIRAKDRARGD